MGTVKYLCGFNLCAPWRLNDVAAFVGHLENLVCACLLPIFFLLVGCLFISLLIYGLRSNSGGQKWGLKVWIFKSCLVILMCRQSWWPLSTVDVPTPQHSMNYHNHFQPRPLLLLYHLSSCFSMSPILKIQGISYQHSDHHIWKPPSLPGLSSSYCSPTGTIPTPSSIPHLKITSSMTPYL